MRIEIEHRFATEGGPAESATIRSPWDDNGKPNKAYTQALVAKRWTFFGSAGHGSSDLVLRIESYEELGRPTPRHRFKVLKRWGHDDERSYRSSIVREDVPVPLSIQHEAAQLVGVVFVPWENMKRAEVGPLGGKLK